MLTIRIIPCLDVRDGRVVKGLRFAGLRDAGSPAELATAYEAQGADELIILDVSATSEGRSAALHTVTAVRQRLAIPLTVGGGVRSVQDAGVLLEAGADKVAVNTAAVARPALIGELAERYGRQCTVLAVDAVQSRPGHWEVAVRSGSQRTGIDVRDWVQEAARRGAGEILLTSWDRDGTRSGYDLDLVRSVSTATNVPVIASGGASTAADLLAALRAGADAVLAASIFHDGDLTIADIKEYLRENGVAVRP